MSISCLIGKGDGMKDLPPGIHNEDERVNLSAEKFKRIDGLAATEPSVIVDESGKLIFLKLTNQQSRSFLGSWEGMMPTQKFPNETMRAKPAVGRGLASQS